MMAAQAAVLSATSTADVNLVKRAPTSDDDDEQSDMTGQSSSVPTSQDSLTEHKEEEQMKHLYVLLCRELGKLTREADFIPDDISKFKAFITKIKECDWEASPACTSSNTEIANSRKYSLALRSN
ncbi:hypothetical protein BASA83_007040 [Batrachochytrium salamandrivorans]|nr:hypothetical protein BASA83_007040 [Batrachochytrium salamandrivorans]